MTPECLENVGKVSGENLNSFEEFLEEAKELQQTFKEQQSEVSTLLFRGQANAEWPLQTTLERATTGAISILQYYEKINWIRPEIETFTERRWNIPSTEDLANMLQDKKIFSPADVFRQHEIYSYMGYLRHHGFPSPFLDWSHSLYVAAYFAFSNIPKDAQKVSICVFQEKPARFKSWTSSEPFIEHFGPVVPGNKRHFLQQSEYTWCVSKKVTEWWFDPNPAVLMHDPEADQDRLLKYNIPVGEKRKALALLQQMNINAYSLFGNQEGLMQTLAFKCFDEN